MTVTFVDPRTATRGHLVIDSLVGGVAAGGLRISPTADVATLRSLARNMTLKQAVTGVRVGGAKAGLAMDPSHPARTEILRRFLTAIRPLVETCYSVGPDLNTTMAELEVVGREVGIPALKIAVGRRHGLPDAEFLRRYGLFESRIDGWSVNELRAPTASAVAVREVARSIQVERPRVAIQGAGNMGGAIAHLLSRSGARIVAWADDEKCMSEDDGLDVVRLLRTRTNGRITDASGAARIGPPAEVLGARCDVLVLAAISRAFELDQIPHLACRAIVEAANLALSGEVEGALHRAGVVVIPDILASAGGSIAVEALYTGTPADGPAILAHVSHRIAGLVEQALDSSRTKGLTPREAAMRNAARGGDDDSNGVTGT